MPRASINPQACSIGNNFLLQEKGPFRCLEYMCKCENASSEALVLLDHEGHNKQPPASGCFVNGKTKPLHSVMHVRMRGAEVIQRQEQIIK